MKAFLLRLQRVGHGRGFGIQSPIDYAFVRYVVSEQWPYYAYSEVGSGDDWLHQKLGRLYFRITNWLQPRIVACSSYREYVKAACQRVAFGESSELIIVPVEQLSPDWLSELYQKVNAQSLLIVEGIYDSLEAKMLWRSIIDDEHTGVTFDLYYCGIVFFDRKRYKRNYVINF